MINYRVRDPRRAAGQAPPAEHPQLGKTEEYWYGRFAWVVDGEGDRVERWEPDHFSPREFERRMKTIEQPR